MRPKFSLSLKPGWAPTLTWLFFASMIVLWIVIYGLCQYDQMNLAWLFLLLPIIYIMLKNILVYYSVSIAHQNAPKEPDNLVNT